MGSKKILRKMPLQKRVPLKRKNLPRPVQTAERSAALASVPLLEDIRDLHQLDCFLESHKQKLGNVLRRYMSQTTQNAAFENKGINAFIKHCLDYVVDTLPAKLVSAQLAPVAACDELRGLVDSIVELETGHKWVIIEWVQARLKEYIGTLGRFETPDREFVVRFLFFIELVNGLMCVPKEIENPLMQATISTACRALQVFNIGSLEAATCYFAVLYELVFICNENKQTLPESLALAEKLATFMTAKMRGVEAAEAGKPTLFALLVDSQLTAKTKEASLLKGMLKLLRNIAEMFGETRCYESAASTLAAMVAKLAQKHPLALGIWETVKTKLIRAVKVREKIKQPLLLHAEKPKEIASFDPIIEDDYLPFRSRSMKKEKSMVDEKWEVHKKKREKRTELRKTKKLSMLREEIRLEGTDRVKEKMEAEKKVQRKAMDQDYMYESRCNRGIESTRR